MKKSFVVLFLSLMLPFCFSQEIRSAKAGRKKSAKAQEVKQVALPSKSADNFYKRATVSKPMATLSISNDINEVMSPDYLKLYELFGEWYKYITLNCKQLPQDTVPLMNFYRKFAFESIPYCMMLTVSYSGDGSYADTNGVDALIAIKTARPVKRKDFVNDLSAVLTEMAKLNAQPISNGLSFKIENTDVSIQLFEDNTVILIGRPDTINAVKEGKTRAAKIPSKNSLFLQIKLPAELQNLLAAQLPQMVPPQVKNVSEVSLLIEREELMLTIELAAAFKTPEDAAGISQLLNMVLQQGKLFVADQPTIAKYLDKAQVKTNGRKCSMSMQMPMLAVAGGIGAAMALPALDKARGKAKSVSCLSNMKQIGLGIMMYADDHNNKYPDANTWEKDIFEYVGDRKVFECPANKGKKYIYMGKNVAESSIELPARTILVVESLNNHKDTVNILFFDGHVSSYSTKGCSSIEDVARKNNLIIIK